MNSAALEFRSRAISPMQCMREGWQLIKDDYWLFLGITVVGLLLGSLAPMALLMGPAMCGLYVAYLNKMEDRGVSFDLLFRGFDYFLPSFIATLIMLVPTFIMLIGVYVVFGIGFFATMHAFGPQGGQGQANSAIGIVMVALFIGLFVAIMLFSMILGALFMFTYPLIVDRRLSGFEAVKLSFRGVWANLGGVIGLMLLTQLLGLLGVLLCYVGAILEMPLGFAMIAVAYRQVFPRHDPLAVFDADDDEPILVGPTGSTEIQASEARPGAVSDIQAAEPGNDVQGNPGEPKA